MANNYSASRTPTFFFLGWIFFFFFSFIFIFEVNMGSLINFFTCIWQNFCWSKLLHRTAFTVSYRTVSICLCTCDRNHRLDIGKVIDLWGLRMLIALFIRIKGLECFKIKRVSVSNKCPPTVWQWLLLLGICYLDPCPVGRTATARRKTLEGWKAMFPR